MYHSICIVIGLCVCVHIQAHRLGGFRGFRRTAHIAAAGPRAERVTMHNSNFTCLTMIEKCPKKQQNRSQNENSKISQGGKPPDPLGFMCALLWVYLLRIMNPPPPPPLQEQAMDLIYMYTQNAGPLLQRALKKMD